MKKTNRSKSRSRRYRRMKVYTQHRGYRDDGHPKVVPELRFSGKWLAELGFDYGSHVSLETSEGKIIIRLDEE